MPELDKTTFTITSDEDEIRVDGLCRSLLRNFHQQLLDKGTPPLEAGELAHGADYFVRDYVISARRWNLFQERAGVVRTFAANWYIMATLEPTIEELAGHLKGIRQFYRFLRDNNLVPATFLEQIKQECDDLAWYEKRIESFWDIQGDGYHAWERECSLKEA